MRRFLLLVKAGRPIDGRSDRARTNVGILIVGDRVEAWGPRGINQAKEL